jgi:hypothetical protein
LLVALGAQRASLTGTARLWAVLLVLAALVAGSLAVGPAPVEAASGPKVVVVVGPVGSKTAEYIREGRALAAAARSYGASVTEIYSPNATWTRVRDAAQGAKLFIYLGHGNGWPSPYAPFRSSSKNGLGLNRSANAGHSNTQYYGESHIAQYIRFAPYAVVILNRLCYASGNSEWGTANPTRTTAIQRVDNYGYGFFKAGAKAVFAEGIGKANYVIYGLFRTNYEMQRIFWLAPNKTARYTIQFGSARYPGARALMDPYASGRYYRSMIGSLGMTATTWRDG